MPTRDNEKATEIAKDIASVLLLACEAHNTYPDELDGWLETEARDYFETVMAERIRREFKDAK